MSESDSPYRHGYEGWEVFDALPIEVKQAHDIVWTGNPHYTNQYRQRLFMDNISMNEALAIIELDEGKYMLARKEIDPTA
jgi:hypothetical protein